MGQLMHQVDVPLAYLKALTDDAQRAVGGLAVPIYRFPFRVGRDSRSTHAQLLNQDRRQGSSPANNDLYLRDHNPSIFVSRDHFQIELVGEGYRLIDRQSAVGTLVEGQLVGGDRQGGSVSLREHDVIIIGSHEGGFIFKFLTTEP